MKNKNKKDDEMAYVEYSPKAKTENEQIQDQIQEAIDLVEEACQLVDDALRSDSRHKSHYEAYGCYGFSQLLGNGNPYDSSLFDLKNKLNEDESE